MKSIIIILWICLSTMGICMADIPKEPFFPYRYEILKLENGLTSYIIPIEGSGLVAYYSIVRTGSRDEYEAGKSGFAHFFEHMMFRGTEKYPGPLYDKMVTEMGANANAYTTDDLTAYHMVVPSQYLEKAIELESDRFQNLSYPEQEFKTEAGAVYGEYRKGRINPYSVLLEELQNTAFDVHTYKHTTMGFEADIKNMPNLYQHSLNFFKRYYRPDNVILLMVGDVDPPRVKKLIHQYYHQWEPGYIAPDIKAEPSQQRERIKEVSYPGKTLPIVWMAYKGEAFRPEDSIIAAASLLGDLAFGENSDLYKKLVIREQKVQFITNWFPLTRDPKLLNIYSMVKNPDDIHYVREEIDRTIAKFQTELVDEQMLENIKKRVRYGFLMRLDTPENIAGSLARLVALTGNLTDINVLYDTYDRVTALDIHAAANKYFQPRKRTVIILKGEM